MIITVTINPAMDKTLLIDNFEIDTVNRVGEIRYDIGGKGINVSKVLNNFGVKSVCTGFLGGTLETEFIQQLNNDNIDTDFVQIKGQTRTNVKIVDKINNNFTDINEAGPSISMEELNKFIDTFEKLCNKGDIVVLAGGVTPSMPKDIYATLTHIAKQKGAFVILDADGELLRNGLEGAPDIIKPNNHELMSIFNLTSDDDENLIIAAKSLLSKGISKVMISLGERGSLLVTEDKVYKVDALKVDVNSTVGAGDSMVAGTIYGLLNNFTDDKLIKFASSCGTASVMTEGTEPCTLEEVENLYKKLTVHEI